MAYEWENSTLEQKKEKLQELQAKLAQAKMDSEYKQQRGGLTRAAEAMMPYDPTGAFNLLDKREALDVKRQQLAASTSGKKALLDEIKAMTWSIQTTNNPTVKQQLSDNLEELNKQYLARYGVTPEQDTGSGESDPVKWLNSYWKGIALASYGKNADGTISRSSDLKSDIKIAARDAGYTILDKDIDAKIEGYNKDVSDTYSAGVKKKEEEISLASGAESLKQQKLDNAYTIIDKKFPKLREEGIDLVRNAVTFVKAGDTGDNSARNNLVKKISRMGSNEALSETDFGRALGRNLGTQFLSRIATIITGAGLPITDEEWVKLRNFAKTYYDEVDGAITEADPSGKLLRRLPAWPSYTKNKNEAAGDDVIRGKGLKKGDTKKVGSVTMTYDGKVWR